MIVVDASVIVDLLLRAPGVQELDARVFAEGEAIHVPHLMDVEVAQVLRRYASRGIISDRRGQMSIELLQQFPLTRHPHDPLLERIWRLRGNVTAHDAAYVALAEGLNAPPLTRDQKLAGVAGHAARIELV